MTKWGLKRDIEWTPLRVEWEHGRQPFTDPDERRVNVLTSAEWTPRELLDLARREDRPVHYLLDVERLDMEYYQ